MSTTEFSYTPHRLDDPAFYRSEIDRIFRKGENPEYAKATLQDRFDVHTDVMKRAEQDTRSIEKETND